MLVVGLDDLKEASAPIYTFYQSGINCARFPDHFLMAIRLDYEC